MSALPYIGASLRESLAVKGRKTWKAAPLCAACHTPAYPRGIDRRTMLCWFCRFPRAQRDAP